MTQNHDLDMDCVTDLKIKKDTDDNNDYKQHLVANTKTTAQPIIDDVTTRLLCLSKTLFDSKKKYLHLKQIIELLIDLENLILNINAFIVLELIKSTKRMLLKIHSLELKIDDNTIKVIDKCINNLPSLIKQHYDYKLQLDDEVLWCMEVADSITEGNDCFFTKILYLDDFTSSILFGKELEAANLVKNNSDEISCLINKNKTNDLENANVNQNYSAKDTDASLAIEITGKIDFLKQALYLAKKLNDLFLYGIKQNSLFNYSTDMINYLNQIKFASAVFYYNKIAFSCYFFAKTYNCIVLFDINITDKQIVAILAKLHGCFIKQIEAYLDLNETSNQQQLETQIKALYNDFIRITNLINDNSVVSNADYYNIINNSNFSSLISKTNCDKQNQNNQDLINVNFSNIKLCLTQIKHLHSTANKLSHIKENFDQKQINSQIKAIQKCCTELTSNINQVIDKKITTKLSDTLKNKNSQNDINKIYSFVATNHLQAQLNQAIQQKTKKQANIIVNIKNLYLYSHTYKQITSIIKKIIASNIYDVLLENNIIFAKNIDSNINFELDIDTIGVKVVISLKSDQFILNDEKLVSLAIKYNIISRNQGIENYSRLNVLLAIIEKLTKTNSSCIIKLYSQIREIGGSLIINGADKSSEFILNILNIHIKYNMLLIKIQNVICAIPANMITQVIEPEANNNNKVISLHKIFDNQAKTNITKCYILIIEFNNKKLEIAVDGVLGFDQLLVESLPLPFVAMAGIDGVAHTNTDDIALIINPFDCQK